MTTIVNNIENFTENASKNELSLVSQLVDAFDQFPISKEEKITAPALFMRRQELSYLLANYEVFKLIQNVKGSIFYFGVFHGAGFMNFANLSAALEPFNHTRRLIGFDTFEGYPEIGEMDKTHGKEYKTLVEGGFKSDTKQHIENLIKLYDQNRSLNHISKLSLVEGDVCQTLPQYLKENQHTVTSLVILTMNLYEPSKKAIELLWPTMPKGAVIVAHSMNEEFYPGITRAVFDALGDDITIQTFPFAPNFAYIVK